jgi:hypothetical protein
MKLALAGLILHRNMPENYFLPPKETVSARKIIFRAETVSILAGKLFSSPKRNLFKQENCGFEEKFSRFT